MQLLLSTPETLIFYNKLLHFSFLKFFKFPIVVLLPNGKIEKIYFPEMFNQDACVKS